MSIPPLSDIVSLSLSPTLIRADFPLQIGDHSREIIDLSPRGNTEGFAVIVTKLGLRTLEARAGSQELTLVVEVFGSSLCLQKMTIGDVNPQADQLRSGL